MDWNNIREGYNYATSLIDSKRRSLFYNLDGNHLPGFKKVEKTNDINS